MTYCYYQYQGKPTVVLYTGTAILSYSLQVSEMGGSLLRHRWQIDGRCVVCRIVRIKEEGEKGRWIGNHPQPLILLISFDL